jgi:hypothetical protein
MKNKFKVNDYVKVFCDPNSWAIYKIGRDGNNPKLIKIKDKKNVFEWLDTWEPPWPCTYMENNPTFKKVNYLQTKLGKILYK